MEKREPSTQTYRLGPFVIKGSENLIVCENDDGVVETKVLPKVMALLLCLCRNARQVVTFDDLVHEIWPREVVGDNAIYNLVGQLRKALGDSASKPVYIQTVSKVGYRLLVEAVQLAPEQSDPAERNLLITRANTPALRFSSLTLVLALLILCAVALVLVFPAPPASSPVYERQLKLARYQLFRGDGQGVEQAIETLQALIVTHPDAQEPKLELAYGFIRKAKGDPENRRFWIGKAQAISKHVPEGPAGQRLSVVLSALVGQSTESKQLAEMFAEDKALVSARMVYSDWLFDAGQLEQASAQAHLALDQCMDCPYVYRKLAATHIVAGQIQEGFEYFSRYRSLIYRSIQNPLENAGYVSLNINSLQDMAKWHFRSGQPAGLLPHQRNTLALFYLSLDQVEAAEALLAEQIEPAEQFFDLYTQAAIAGANGDFETSYRLLNRRLARYPDNDRFTLSVAYALWLLGRYEEAMAFFEQHQILKVPNPLPDTLPFPTWSLYAALLINTGNPELGEKILNKMEQQLSAGLVPGSQQGDIRLAAILALQNKHEDALTQLNIAISQGWVSDFNQSWWYLEDSPYFRALREDVRFKQLAKTYHQGIKNLVTSARSTD